MTHHRMNIQLLILLVTIIIDCAQAQSIRFSRTYNFPFTSKGKSFLQTGENGYLLLGEKRDSSLGPFSTFLLKTDKFGELVWQRTFGSPEYNNAVQIRSAPNGGFRLTGLTSYGYPWWMEIDSTGSIVDSLTLQNAPASSVYTLTAGAGFIYCKLDQPQTQDLPYLHLSAFSPVGDSLWSNRILVSSKYFAVQFASVLVTKSGDLCITGTEVFQSGVNESEAVFLIRTSPRGDSLWKLKYYSPEPAENFQHIVSMFEGSDSTITVLSTSTNFGKAIRIQVARVTKGGQLLANWIYGPLSFSSQNSSPGTITQTFTSGFAIPYTIWGPSTSNPGGFLLTLSASGDTVFNRQFVPGPHTYDASAIAQDADSGFAIVGSLLDHVTRDNALFFAKTGPDGIVTGIKEPYDLRFPDTFALRGNYPNPFNSSTNILISVGGSALVNVSIYNSIGQLVTTISDRVFEPGNHVLHWNAQLNSTGVYFCRMIAGSNTFVLPIMHLK